MATKKLQTRGTNVRIQKLSFEDTIPATIIAIASANKVTVEGYTQEAVPVGAIVVFTGVSTLVDGKPYLVEANTSTDFTVSAGPALPVGAPANASLLVWHYNATLDLMPCFCIKDLKYTAEAGTEIVVKTYCGTEKYAGEAGTGTLSWGGVMAPDDDAFKEMMACYEDGKPRILRWDTDGTTFLASIIVNSFSVDWTMDGMVDYTSGAVLNSKLTWSPTPVGYTPEAC
jgi:hypothetical protein